MQVIVIGGPAGTGKTTMGTALATYLHCPYIEGDNLHPQENIDKMSQGIALTDEVRWGWLENLSKKATLTALDKSNESGVAVVSCLMLKKVYREYISAKSLEVDPQNQVTIRFVFLYTTLEELVKRVTSRQGHYMKSGMVVSQYKIMEIPSGSELVSQGGQCWAVDTTNRSPEELVRQVNRYFASQEEKDGYQAAPPGVKVGQA